jgi:hypothetical protein
MEGEFGFPLPLWERIKERGKTLFPLTHPEPPPKIKSPPRQRQEGLSILFLVCLPVNLT